MVQVLMDASRVGGTIQTQYSGVVVCDEDGLITVDSQDIPSLVAAGVAFPLLNVADMNKKIEERAKAEADRQEVIRKSEEERLKREGIVAEGGEDDDERPTRTASVASAGPSGPTRQTTTTHTGPGRS
jgi:hypothetical protein